MIDFAVSDSPEVQAQLDRLAALSLPQGRFGLETVRELLSRLGDPQDRIPPAFHIAGTNGKGSTAAFLRAMLEAEGLSVHATTSPHLVRYNERIRIAGKLIEDSELAALLAEVLDTAADLPLSFFEATIAASFLAFSRHPADASVVEVGLGGRFDATNVLDRPAACGVATLGIDHEAFLLRPEAGTPEEPLARIAFEKASIAKAGSPLVTLAYPLPVAKTVIDTAMHAGARLAMRGLDWFADPGDAGIAYRDRHGELVLPLPVIPGAHQTDNAALAAATLRHQDVVAISPEAIARGILVAQWPARLQRLAPGPLAGLAPGHTIWLDGGHNADAGRAIARHFSGSPPLHLIIGMLASKDPSAILTPLAGLLRSVSVVPAPGHDTHPSGAFAPFTSLPARPFADVSAALAALPPEGDVLIAGSLYLAGDVLRRNGEMPD